MHNMDMERNGIYLNLQRKYLTVFLLAIFADWLQGPYLYKIYVNHNYEKQDISLLYIIGFASSTIFGVIIGHIADRIGRKILSISYSVLYSLSCISILSDHFWILLIGRVLSGISTSILFSTFESWYMNQHIEKKLPIDWIGATLTKTTFYNGLCAIIAGILASFVAVNLNLGPSGPFVLAVPILMASGILCAILWDENREDFQELTQRSWTDGIWLIFTRSNRLLLYLGIVQALFETCIYVFIFLWTPVLEPLHPRHGIIFSIFMLCIMLGSFLNSTLYTKYRISRDYLLKLSIILGLCSIFLCLIGSILQDSHEILGSKICLVAFLAFEVSIGMYYPAIGYLRGVVFPESHRACISNFFRVPSNLLTCVILMYIRNNVPRNYLIFSISFVSLAIATTYSFKFAKLYRRYIEAGNTQFLYEHV